jgi:heterodisulfide reductase subunit A
VNRGVFVAGACQGPKDIPDSVAQGAAAAAEALALLSQGVVEAEPVIAEVNKDLCSGCRICISVCPYNATVFDRESKTASVQEVLCQGCGTCVASCPSGARTLRQRGFTDKQILAEIEAILLKRFVPVEVLITET